MRYYFSFGFGHRHEIDDLILDRDCVVCVKVDAIADSPDAMMQARRIFTDYLGGSNEWTFQRTEDEYISLGEQREKYFPRGIVKTL